MADPKQLSFGFDGGQSPRLKDNAEDQRLKALDERGKRKPRRRPTARQIWAIKVFLEVYDELPDGVHQAIGCGCQIKIRGGLFFPMPCDLHPDLQGAQFELPPELVEKGRWAAAERERYYELPVEPLTAERLAQLEAVGIPWDENSLGRPEVWKGKLFTHDNGCGCKFSARKITVEGTPDETRTGHYWWTIKVKSCGGENAGWCRFPNLEVDETFGRRWGRK